MTFTELVRYDAMGSAIAECHSVDEVAVFKNTDACEIGRPCIHLLPRRAVRFQGGENLQIKSSSRALRSRLSPSIGIIFQSV